MFNSDSNQRCAITLTFTHVEAIGTFIGFVNSWQDFKPRNSVMRESRCHDVMTRKRFPYYWPFMRVIPHKESLMRSFIFFPLKSVWTR